MQNVREAGFENKYCTKGISAQFNISICAKFGSSLYVQYYYYCYYYYFYTIQYKEHFSKYTVKYKISKNHAKLEEDFVKHHPIEQVTFLTTDFSKSGTRFFSLNFFIIQYHLVFFFTNKMNFANFRDLSEIIVSFDDPDSTKSFNFLPQYIFHHIS